MMSVDAYLRQVQRGLGGMDPHVREDILKELRSHLADSLSANGGNVSAATDALGDPVSVARRYRELYGYSSSYRLLFYAVAGVVGILTVPVLVAGEESVFPYFLSSIFVASEFVFLIWISVMAGNRAGLLAGVWGVLGRMAGLGVAIAANRESFLITADGLGAFLLVCLLFLFVGWIPGKARQAWQRPGAEL
ncbi:MAG TPA: hypothetical protein VK723_03545 [Thermoplasmata archaeon]|nr:hypothetical protein [Thermoplasmata archaeon]